MWIVKQKIENKRKFKKSIVFYRKSVHFLKKKKRCWNIDWALGWKLQRKLTYYLTKYLGTYNAVEKVKVTHSNCMPTELDKIRLIESVHNYFLLARPSQVVFLLIPWIEQGCCILLVSFFYFEPFRDNALPLIRSALTGEPAEAWPTTAPPCSPESSTSSVSRKKISQNPSKHF